MAEIPIRRLSGYPIASGTLPAKRVSEVLGLVDASLVKEGEMGRREGIVSFYRLPKPNVFEEGREERGNRKAIDQIRIGVSVWN